MFCRRPATRAKASTAASRCWPLLVALLSGAAPSFADDSLVRDIRQEFGSSLPVVEALVPGYRRPAAPPASLAVGNFVPADDSLLMHSFAIGDVLRWRIQFVPTVKLTMPSAFSTATDSAVDREPYDPVLATPEHFAGLNKTLGIANGLTGSLSRDGEHIVIDARLIATAGGETRSSRTWRATEQTLPAALIAISTWVYDELGVTLSADERAYLEDETSLRPEALAAFVRNMEAVTVGDLPARKAAIAGLRKAHPHLAILVAYELYARDYPTTPQEVTEHLAQSKAARTAFPKHGGVALESYRTIAAATLDEHQTAKHIRGLRDLASDSRDDPMILLNLAIAHGDQGDYFKAVAIGLEVVERWPDYYRAWWILGNLVNERSWQVRGEGYLREISAADRKRFRRLAALGDRLTDVAIRMHGRNADLWQSKVNGIGTREGYSARLMAAFEEGVRVAPEHRPIYDNALNYAQDKWGGNASARRRIITLAEANNPDAAWPKMMRSKYAGDFSGLRGLSDDFMDDPDVRRILENPTTWQILFVLIVALMVLYSYVSAWRARRAAAADAYVYRDDGDHGQRSNRELTPEQKLDQLQRGPYQ